jgi:hypothetical protein
MVISVAIFPANMKLRLRLRRLNIQMYLHILGRLKTRKYITERLRTALNDASYSQTEGVQMKQGTLTCHTLIFLLYTVNIKATVNI